MSGKQSTIFYHEWLELFEELSTEEVGTMTLAILRYETNGDIPTFSDRTMKAIWKTIRSTLDRNKQKYNEICEKRSVAGKKGGRPRKEEPDEKAKKQKDNFAFSEKAKKADSDSDSERDKDSDSDNDSGGGSECEREGLAPPDTTTTTQLQEAIVESWNSFDFTQKIKRLDNPVTRWKRTELAIELAGGKDQFLGIINSLDQQAYLKRQPDAGYKVIYDWLVKPDIFQALIEGKYKEARNKFGDGWEVVEYG